MSAARKIAFIGSHSVRKTNAVHSFAGAVGRSGRSVEVGREVVRFSPLGMNERATPEAQLWVIMAQIREELELRTRAEVLVLDRALVDNFAYFLRVTKGRTPSTSRRWWPAGHHLRPVRPAAARHAAARRRGAQHQRALPQRDREDPRRDHAEARARRPADRDCRPRDVTDSFDWPSLVERLCGPRPPGPVVPQPVTYAPTLWE
jgi:hypothetical protein